MAVAETEKQEETARVMNALRRLVRALRTSNRAVERAVGISGAQLFVLRQLAEVPRQSLSDLVRSTLTHQSSVSEVVGRLEEAGLVSRRWAADDARRAELALTAKGHALLRKAPDPVQAVLAEGFQQLPSAMRRNLADGLEAWLAAAYLADLPATLFFEPTGAQPRPGLRARWRRARGQRQ